MIIGLGGKRKKPTYNLPVLGSPLINALKRITSHVINYAALGLLPYYLPQTVSSTLSHTQSNGNTLNKMKRRKTKPRTFIWARKTIRRPSNGTRFHNSLLSHSAFPPSPEKGEPFGKQPPGCVGRRHNCFLLLIFLSNSCWLGISNRLFKSFPIQAVLHFK